MGKPFKVNETPAKNIATKEKAAPPPGKAIVESHHKTGAPLPEASKNTPDHEPLIPWPQPAMGVDHKPFKTSK